jgi:hypothetical protein
MEKGSIFEKRMPVAPERAILAGFLMSICGL